MKYTCSIIINLPLKQVVDLWSNEDKYKKWQDGFVRIEHISGKKGEQGSQSKIYLEQGKNKIELLETIFVDNLPDERTALYEHIHMTNTQTTQFNSISDDKTKMISKVEYTKFNGIIVNALVLLMPWMFKNQSLTWLKNFKKFAEQTT